MEDVFVWNSLLRRDMILSHSHLLCIAISDYIQPNLQMFRLCPLTRNTETNQMMIYKMLRDVEAQLTQHQGVLSQVERTVRYLYTLIPVLDAFSEFKEDFTVLKNDTVFLLFSNAMRTHLKDMKFEMPTLDTAFSHESLYSLPGIRLQARHSKTQISLAQQFIRRYLCLKCTRRTIENVQCELVYNERLKDPEYFHMLNQIFQYYGLRVDRNTSKYFKKVVDEDSSSRIYEEENLSTLGEQAFFYLYFKDKRNGYRLFDGFILGLQKNVVIEWLEELLLKLYALQLLTGILTDADSEHLQLVYLKLFKSRWLSHTL